MTQRIVTVDKKRSHSKQAHWTQKQRFQAVNAYVVLGKVTLVAATTGVPEDTLRKWKTTDWWKDAEAEIRRSNKIELSGKLQNVINKTVLALEDRIDNGDFFFNPKTGAWERKPVSAAVAHRVASDLIDKTLVLEKAAENKKESDEGLEHRLQKLQEEMIRFAKAKTIEGEIIKHELPQEADRSDPQPVSEEGPTGQGSTPGSTTSGGFDSPELPPGYNFSDTPSGGSQAEEV